MLSAGPPTLLSVNAGFPFRIAGQATGVAVALAAAYLVVFPTGRASSPGAPGRLSLRLPALTIVLMAAFDLLQRFRYLDYYTLGIAPALLWLCDTPRRRRLALTAVVLLAGMNTAVSLRLDRNVLYHRQSFADQSDAAVEAGADEVVVEKVPGYGSCCMRALAEASRGADVVILCEGDCTFVAADVKKFLAYLENCDLVLGTRATQELRETDTQMDWLINPANQIVAKLVQVRFWGTRLTDVGCTYRAMRVASYERLRGRLHVRGNHYSPHMFIETLRLRMRVIEIPIVFRARVGMSKGVGANKLKAAGAALRMLGLIYSA